MHQETYGIEIAARDAKGNVTMVRCKFCKFFPKKKAPNKEDQERNDDEAEQPKKNHDD